MLALILAGYLLLLLDVAILLTALPSLRDDLGFSASELSWVQNAYVLAFGGLLLVGARAGDVFGHRRAFRVGTGLFAVASLAVGLAQSPGWLIAARAAQGAGAALIAPSTLALLSTNFAEGRPRERAMSAYGALSGLGRALGLILGGVVTVALSWRAGFLINVPIAVVVIVTAPRLLTETDRQELRLEIPAALTATVGITALVFGIVHSDTAGWGDPITLLTITAGVVLVCVFVRGQGQASEPLLPLALLAGRQRAGVFAVRCLFNAALLSFYFFFTQYLQGVLDLSAFEAGLSFLPLTLAAFAAGAGTSMPSPAWATRRRRQSDWPSCSSAPPGPRRWRTRPAASVSCCFPPSSWASVRASA